MSHTLFVYSKTPAGSQVGVTCTMSLNSTDFWRPPQNTSLGLAQHIWGGFDKVRLGKVRLGKVQHQMYYPIDVI